MRIENIRSLPFTYLKSTLNSISYVDKVAFAALAIFAAFYLISSVYETLKNFYVKNKADSRIQEIENQFGNLSKKLKM